MEKSPVRILKAEHVKVNGSINLPLATAAQKQSTSAPSAVAEKAELDARVIKKDTDFVLIELTCTCGRKTRLKCNYAGPAVPEEEPVESNQ